MQFAGCKALYRGNCMLISNCRFILLECGKVTACVRFVMYWVLFVPMQVCQELIQASLANSWADIHSQVRFGVPVPYCVLPFPSKASCALP